MQNKTFFLTAICCITFLGCILRVWGFASIPGELNRDEAALGYNAFSILREKTDEWGKVFPVVFRSFGDYKLPGYIYTLIPFIQIFGLTPFAVRLPSLLAGTALIPLTYFFVKTFLKRPIAGLFSAFFLAVSPWAIHYSKIGFEANLALCLFVGGLVCFLFSEKNNIYKYVSCIAFFLSFLTYNAPLLLIPGILTVFWLCGYRHLWKMLVGLFLVAMISFLLVFPATKGKSAITIFSDPGLVDKQHTLRSQAGNNVIKRIYTTRIVFYGTYLVRNILNTYSPQFLVIGGGRNPWHQLNGYGHLTWPLYVFAIIGAGTLFFEKKLKSHRAILFWFLFLSPLPAIITTDAPHATRSLFFFFMLTVFMGIGARWLLQKRLKIGWIVCVFGVIFAFVFGLHYTYAYQRIFTHNPQIAWNIGLSEAYKRAEEARTKLIKKEDIPLFIAYIGDTKYAYIHPLFYGKISPKFFQDTVQYSPPDTLGMNQVLQFGYYLFVNKDEDLPKDTCVLMIEQEDSTSFSVAPTARCGTIEL